MHHGHSSLRATNTLAIHIIKSLWNPCVDKKICRQMTKLCQIMQMNSTSNSPSLLEIN